MRRHANSQRKLQSRRKTASDQVEGDRSKDAKFFSRASSSICLAAQLRPAHARIGARDDKEAIVAIVSSFEYAPFDESDPDDFRPNSRWALLVDPGDNSGVHVDDITVIVEEIAPGDRIPLHTHPINEVIVIGEGMPEIMLGDDVQEVGPGAVVFIRAGTPHGTRNTSTTPIRIHAMFPSERIGIEYLERNPAPNLTRLSRPPPSTPADSPKPDAPRPALAGPRGSGGRGILKGGTQRFPPLTSMEAGGIEPPSAVAPSRTSTSVVRA
jgi:quercetin dioxygenase-like cupin family protein